MMTVRNGTKEPVLVIGCTVRVAFQETPEDPPIGTVGTVLAICGTEGCCIACDFPTFKGHRFHGEVPKVNLATPTGWWMLPKDLRHMEES